MATPGREYDEEFFEALREGALRSAEVIVPLVLELIRPRSVVDVGCGTGLWLATFAQHGVVDYLGVDRFAPPGLLAIPRDRFIEADLTHPLELGRVFDLAISLEVAEHLPDGSASRFIESLTRLAPVVLFSAAIPGQGGTNHVNEQWPDYWSCLFAARGFDPIDIVRPRIWHNESVELWYAQNTILYVARSQEANLSQLQHVAAVSGPPLAAVHPRLLAERQGRLNETIRACAEATGRAERLNRTLAAKSEDVRALSDRLKQLEQIAAEQRGQAEYWRAEGVRCLAQATAAGLCAEAAQETAAYWRAAATDARKRAAWVSLEAQQYAELLQGKLDRARAEAEVLHTEVKHHRFMAEPANMSLGPYLRALPQVISGVLRRAIRWAGLGRWPNR